MDGVRYAFGMGRWDPYSVALVVVHGGTNVPSIDAVRGPSAMLCGFSWTIMQVPGGASGVQVKSKVPSSWA